MTRVLIVGGGIGGLASAWWIRRFAAERGMRCTISICEAGTEWGGVARTRRRDGWLLEEGPDSILSSKPAGIELLRMLGVEDELCGVRPEARRACIVRKGRLVQVPDGLYLLAPGRWWPFICSPLLSWAGKLRMAGDLVLPRRYPAGGEESLAAFVRRRLGREALERIAQPMIGGIYTADPERLSLSATMPQFPAMEHEHRSLLLAMRRRAKQMQTGAGGAGPRYGLFCTPEHGMQRVVDVLCEQLEDVDLRASSPVRAVRREGGHWRADLSDGQLDADVLVLALPAHRSAELLREDHGALADELAAIPYAGVATLNVGLRREQIARLPEAAGFVVPEVEHRSLLACTIASGKYPGRAPPGRVLLRAFIGGAMHEDELRKSDAELVDAALSELDQLLGISGEAELLHLRRWPKSMAQHVLGHADRLARIRAAEGDLPGLALVGNGFEGVGIPDVAAQAQRAARRLIASGDD